MIDLHLHTTASDGRSAPTALVHEAIAAGLTTIAVTDHDTLAATAAVAAEAATLGLQVVPGIEITAMQDGRDVHILAYFVDPASPELSEFLRTQREDRRRRFLLMLDALDAAGIQIDQQAMRQRAGEQRGRALGRPLLAEALIRSGHARSVAEAFERFLGDGRPAFVPRIGAAPDRVIEIVQRAGGLTSLAHPGKLRHDELIPDLVKAGLPAIEVHHPDHDAIDVGRYRQMAATYGLLMTGGSDYHGPGSGRSAALGQVTLPRDDFQRLVDRAGWTDRWS